MSACLSSVSSVSPASSLAASAFLPSGEDVGLSAAPDSGLYLRLAQTAVAVDGPQALARGWRSELQVLLPHRALLVVPLHESTPSSLPQWLGDARRLQCQAIVCNYELWNTESVALAKTAGFRLLSYTVNDDAAAAQLQAWGTDGIITDRVNHFVPSA